MKWQADGQVLLAVVGALLFGCASAGNPASGLTDGGAVGGDGGTGGDGGACTSVEECPPGTGCLNGRCEVTTRFDCRSGTSPIVQISPSILDFGSVRVGTPVERTLRVQNLGSCNLSVREISLDTGISPEFTCAQCRPGGTYPVILIPFDSKSVMVSYLATDAAPDTGSLSVVTDDPQYPLVRVPLRSVTKDQARISVDPLTLDFGYVPQGQTKTLAFTIKNVGGQTPLEVRAVENYPLTSTDFQLAVPQTAPFFLNAGDPPVKVDVTYRPQSLAVHNQEARIASSDALTPLVKVRLNGFSVTPPTITVSPTTINFGDVALGQMKMEPVTIGNSGGADLSVHLAFAALSSSAYGFNPTAIGSIAGGGNATVYVQFLPTVLGSAQAILNVNHNVPGTQSPVQVTVTGNATPSTGEDVLALEMTFENGDDGFWASDLRDIDLHYTSPYLQDCSKQAATPNWGTFGTPQWLGIGPRQEPERVIHTNPGTTDGNYRVELLYVEDCSDLPVQLVAQLAGVTVELVLRYLTEGLLGGVGGTIANIIATTCFGRSASNAQVKAYVNGQIAATRTVRLSNRGDMVKVFDVERRSGRFTIR
jgi:hypothetical protein